MRFLLLLTALVALSVAAAGDLPRIHVQPGTGHFVDQHGRVRIFRGINSVIKGFPWYDPKMLDERRIQQLSRDCGFNVVRLGAMWTGVEPEEGQVNESYVDVLKGMVSSFEAEGIYTLLDMHQDVLWQGGKDDDNGYWGVPPWIKHKLPEPEHYYAWPVKLPLNMWPCGYPTDEISTGFQDIYDNVAGTADSLAAFWRGMAEIFKDKKSVLGYELINEPWVGNIFKDFSLMLPGVAGRRNLVPLYDRVHEAIRSVDDDTILFWEPVTFAYMLPIKANPILDNMLEDLLSQYTVMDFSHTLSAVCGELQENATVEEFKLNKLTKGLAAMTELSTIPMAVHLYGNKDESEKPSVFGPGFAEVPGGPDYLNRTVFSWHYYCWAIIESSGGGGNSPYDPMQKALCDQLIGPMTFETVKMRAGELGGSGTMLTEFGLCYPNITNPESRNTEECDFVMDQMDSRLESWIYWDTATGGVFWDGDGNLIPERMRVFVRPYPVAIAGSPKNISFDIFTREFHFEFISDLNSGMPTEIFVPEMQYPGGSYIVQTSPDLSWSPSATRPDYIDVMPKSAAFFDGGTNDIPPLLNTPEMDEEIPSYVTILPS